ncbi:hypothetical protein DFH08DRAFT_699172, partial [Mycena albidolilacea]
FLWTVSQTWGITISAAILENIMEYKFPSCFRLVTILPAFGHGISVIYQVMIGVAGLGFLCEFFMKEVPMRSNVDQKFSLKESGEKPDVEKSPSADVVKVEQKLKEEKVEVEHVGKV